MTAKGALLPRSSSTALLGNGGAFTGTWEDALEFGTVLLTVWADQAGTLVVNWGPDGTNADVVESFAISASTGLSVVRQVKGRYVQIVYTNGATPQGAFRLNTYAKYAPETPTSVAVVGSAVSIADGSDVAEGATTDAAVTTNATGTISGKLRGLVAILADVWDSVNHRLNVALPAATVTTLTPPPAITGFALDSTVAKDATIATSNVLLEDIDVDVELLHTDLAAQAKLTDTQPVSVAALPLPTGAATDATIAQIAANTASLPWYAQPQAQPFFVGS